jgi:hypothetical protein
MVSTWVIKGSVKTKVHRRGVAAVEFAVCLPVMLVILSGLWEVGRMTEVQNVVWNSAREGARDASGGQATLLAVADNVRIYLQGAEPTAFGQGHPVTMIASVVTLPANTTGYTCWDNTTNRELFTITFTDVTNTTVVDPTGMKQLDHYQIGVQLPYASVGWIPVARITGRTRLSVSVDWASLVDAPFQIAPSLPAE